MNAPADALTKFPLLLSRLVEALPHPLHSVRPEGQPFAFVEHCWHLADLEREGFGVRIERLKTEVAPFLADFDGEKAAQLRRYLEQPAKLGAEVFASARAANIRAIASLTAEDRERSGYQQTVGVVRLGELAEKIWEHDRAHAAELAELLAALPAPVGFVDELTAFADGAKRSTPRAA